MHFVLKATLTDDVSRTLMVPEKNQSLQDEHLVAAEMKPAFVEQRGVWPGYLLS